MLALVGLFRIAIKGLEKLLDWYIEDTKDMPKPLASKLTDKYLETLK